MKTCTKCRTEKPLIEYHKYRSGSYIGNLYAHCKQCERERTKKWRDNNKKRLKVLTTRWAENNRDRMLELSNNWRKNNPEKSKANTKVHNSVRQGFLKKPSRCSKCGTVLPKKQIHGHHSDYTKPLEVVWVCSQCHRNIHSKGVCCA